MKLRIKGHFLRVRVARSEVTRLLAGDCLEETIYFTPDALRLQTSLSRLAVQYIENRLVILLPTDQAIDWGVTDQVGIEENLALGHFGSLVVLIEKDFACLDRSEEDNEDTFPNPNASAVC
jgi:hypothetical protein